MRIQPITTNNNPQFKQLKIYKPQEWDVDVLDRVVKNSSIREYATYLSKKGKDLVVSSKLKPIPIIMASVDDKWESIVLPNDHYTKESLLENLDKFDYKKILKHHEKEKLALEASQDKRDSILAEVDEFNKTISPNQQPQPQLELENTKPKKRNFFLRLLGIK